MREEFDVGSDMEAWAAAWTGEGEADGKIVEAIVALDRILDGDGGWGSWDDDEPGLGLSDDELLVLRDRPARLV